MAANVVSFGGLAPFVVTRQVVGGAALEEMRLDERPAVFTVAGHAVERPRPRRAGHGPVRSPSRWRTPISSLGSSRLFRARPTSPGPEVGAGRRWRRSWSR